MYIHVRACVDVNVRYMPCLQLIGWCDRSVYCSVWFQCSISFSQATSKYCDGGH
jgi:hypothetical protein